MKPFQNIPFILHFSALAVLIAAIALFVQPVQADPVLRGYWTFDSDTVESGVITESSGYLPGVHNGTLINNTSVVDEQTVNGISFNPIAGESGNHLSSGNYISFTNDSYAVIDHTGTLVQSDCQSTFDFGGGAFTISAWVKGLPNDVWEPFIAKNGESYGYQLRRNGDSVTPTITYRLSDGEDDPGVNIPNVYNNLNDNNWHHLVGVYGGTYRELYMDGRLVTRIADSATTAGGEGEPLAFSARYVGGYQGFSNISLDDVAIYSGALQSYQALYLFKGGDPAQISASTFTPTENDYEFVISEGSQTVGPLANKSDNPSSLFKSGAGELILSGNNAYTGSTYITGGTITLQTPGETGTLAPGNSIYVDGANSVLQGHGDVLGYGSGTVGAILLQNGGTYHNDSLTEHTTIGAVIYMNNGIVSADGAGHDDVGNFILDNSIIVETGTDNVLDCQRVVIRSGGIVNVAGGAEMTYKANVLNGSSSLIKQGNGTLVVEGEYQPIDRDIHNQGGTLILKNSVLNSRVQTHNGGHTIVDVGEDGIVQMPTDGYTYSLMIGNGSDGAFTLNSGNVIVRYPDLNYPYGSVQLGTNGAVHGSLTINGGHMQVDGRILMSANNDNATSELTINGGLLSLGVEGRYADNYDPACGVIWIGQGKQTTINLNGGMLSMYGMIQSGSDEFGSFNFNGGTLQAVANNDHSFLIPAGGMKFYVKEGGAIIDTQSFDVAVSALLQAPDSGVSGGLTKIGSGTLELTNRNTFTGNVVINEGVLKASIGILDGAPTAGGALGDANVEGRTITVNSGATLEFAAINVLGNAGSFDFKTRVIADGGTIRNAPNADGQPYNSFVLLNNPEFKNGATLIDNGGFNDWHSYTLNGEVTISADDPTKGSANQVQFLVGTGEVVNDGIFPNGVNFNVADVTGDDSTDLLVSTRFRGTPQNIAGSYTKSGAGTMELTNFNENTGNVTISEGALKLSGNGTIGYGSVINNATLEFAYESDQTFGNAISGAGNVVKSGNSTLTLTQAPGYTGATTVESGTLALLAGGTLYNLSGGSVNDDGSVAIAAAVDASGKELTIDNAVMTTFVGSIKAQSILKTGYGTLKIYADEQNKVVADTFTVSASELDYKGYFEGSLEVINGAFFSPGNSIGEANVTGNVSFITNDADSNGFAYFEFGDFTGADENHDLLVLSASSLFNANDEAGVVLLDFANDDASDWASSGVDYLLVKNGAFENGKDYTSWLTPTFTDLFSLQGRADGLYLIGLAAPPQPGSGVPEPSTWALLILGVAGLFLRKRKNERR